MNNKTKRTNKKSKKTNKSVLNRDILGIVILALGLLVLLSLFSTKMGLVGQIINGTTFSLMGYGGYYFPLLIFGIGIVFILDRFENLEFEAIISLTIVFISFLIIADGINTSHESLINRIRNSILLSELNKGGGVIGSLFGFFL